MAFAPTQLLSTPYEDYAGYWIKCYEAGTTTPLSMATDGTGSTLIAQAEVSSGGAVPIGFIKTAGGALLNPFVDGDYDSWLFPTEAEASADNTTNAIQIADNLNTSLKFTDTINESKGADVTSANDAVLLNDGNYNDVTGTTEIHGFTTPSSGNPVRKFRFDGALTLKHATAPSAGFSQLWLKGEVDLSVIANDGISFQYDGTYFRMIGDSTTNIIYADITATNITSTNAVNNEIIKTRVFS